MPCSAANGLPTAEKCVGSKRFILHAEQGMTALSAQLFCKQRYGGSARLAEILTVEEMAAVKELSLAVGVTGTARMCLAACTASADESSNKLQPTLPGDTRSAAYLDC